LAAAKLFSSKEMKPFRKKSHNPILRQKL